MKNRLALKFRGVDKAAVLYGIGKRSEAIRCLNWLLSRNPRCRNAILLKARILSEMGHARESTRLVNSVLEKTPRNYEGLLTKAHIAFDRGRFTKSARIFEDLSKRRLPVEERRYLYYFWIEALVATHSPRKPRQILAEALDQFPDDDVLGRYKALLDRSG